MEFKGHSGREDAGKTDNIRVRMDQEQNGLGKLTKHIFRRGVFTMKGEETSSARARPGVYFVHLPFVLFVVFLWNNMF